jgi:hypothetical protein
MEHSSHLEKAIRGALIALILIFFLLDIPHVISDE